MACRGIPGHQSSKQQWQPINAILHMYWLQFVSAWTIVSTSSSNWPFPFLDQLHLHLPLYECWNVGILHISWLSALCGIWPSGSEGSAVGFVNGVRCVPVSPTIFLLVRSDLNAAVLTLALHWPLYLYHCATRFLLFWNPLSYCAH